MLAVDDEEPSAATVGQLPLLGDKRIARRARPDTPEQRRGGRRVD